VNTDPTQSPARDAFTALQLQLILVGLQSPINIGLILRLAEAYSFSVNSIDSDRVFNDPGKMSTVSDFACGALLRRGLHRLESMESLTQLRRGRRLIATAIGENTMPLTGFQFQPGDLVALGNEYDGLSDKFVREADVVIQVPTPPVWMPKEPSNQPIDPQRKAPVARDGEPSLNVAVTAGIVCYAAYAQWLVDHPLAGRVDGS